MDTLVPIVERRVYLLWNMQKCNCHSATVTVQLGHYTFYIHFVSKKAFHNRYTFHKRYTDGISVTITFLFATIGRVWDLKKHLQKVKIFNSLGYTISK